MSKTGLLDIDKSYISFVYINYVHFSVSSTVVCSFCCAMPAKHYYAIVLCATQKLACHHLAFETIQILFQMQGGGTLASELHRELLHNNFVTMVMLLLGSCFLLVKEHTPSLVPLLLTTRTSHE